MNDDAIKDKCQSSKLVNSAVKCYILWEHLLTAEGSDSIQAIFGTGLQKKREQHLFLRG